MPWGFADNGIRCRQCGHFLNVLTQAIPELPDPLEVTCPYCGYRASYPKSAICSDIAIIADKANAVRWAFVLFAVIGIILVLGLIATRARSAEPDPAPLHTSAEDCAIIAAVGKAKLGWGAAAPQWPLSRDSSGQDCDWARLGIVGPSVAAANDGPYFQGLRWSFSHASYGPDGMASIEYGVGGNSGPSNYFAAGYRCTLSRKAGQWQLFECKMRYVT